MKWKAPLKIEVFDSEETTARAAAKFIAAEAKAAVSSRGRFVLAVSGGHTSCIMLRALRDESCPWKEMHVVQVDERLALAEDPDRKPSTSFFPARVRLRSAILGKHLEATHPKS